MLVFQHHDRALGLLDPEPGPLRWRALLGRGKAAVQQRRIDARDDLLTVLAEAKAAGEIRPQAEALTQLGAAEIAVGAYDVADETLADALECWREIGDDAGGADVLRELGVSHLFRGDLVQAERFVSEALAAYRSAGRERGARGRCRTWRGSRSRAATSRRPKSGCSSRRARSPSSATGAGSVGRTGCSRSSGTTRDGSRKRRRSPSTSRSTAARPATAGPSA